MTRDLQPSTLPLWRAYAREVLAVESRLPYCKGWPLGEDEVRARARRSDRLTVALAHDTADPVVPFQRL